MAAEEIGLVGFGLLGSALAERLLAAGFRLACFDRERGRRAEAERRGCRVPAGCADIAGSCARILLSLPGSEAVARVVAEMDAALRPGRLLVDTTTGDPLETGALALRLAERGVRYMDASISGSSEQVRMGDVLVMAGGRSEDVDACMDLFACFGGRWLYAGPAASGQTLKLVTNLVLGLNRAALAEGLAFAAAVGIDGETALHALTASAAYSRVMDTKGLKMVREDFAPQARLSQHLKDVRLILDAARRAGLPLPLSEAHCRLLEEVERAGLGGADNSAIIRAYRRDR